MNDPTTPATLDLGRLWRFTRKELREVLRDRRTILTLVLMPLLLYPLLAIAMQQLFRATSEPPGAMVFKIGFPSDADYQQFNNEIFSAANRAAQRSGGKNPEWLAHNEPKLDTNHLTVEIQNELQEGNVHVVLHKQRLSSPPNGPEELPPRPSYVWQMTILEGSREGAAAYRYLRNVFTLAEIDYLETQVKPRPNAPNSVSTLWTVEEVPALPRKSGGVVSTLIPLILVLMTITGAVYPAIDLTAGERERGTLEVLMAAPVPRLWLLLAKFAAVWTVSLLTALINMGMMTLTILATGLGPMLFGPEGVTLLLVVQVLALLVLFALFFSAVLLSLTSFARSFKEAQAYLVPLMLLSLAPGVATLLPDLSLRGPMALMPLMNVVLLARDLFTNNAEPQTAFVVVFSTLLYAALALSVAARLFGAEAVLYADHGGWRDLLRRPTEVRNAASLSNALLCLALLFVAQFLLGGAIAQAKLPPLTGALLLACLAVVLFIGFPMIAAILERVRLVPGFQLTRPPPLGLLGGLFLGLSLWPLAAVLVLLFQRFSPLPMDGGLGERIQKMIAEWRESGLEVTLVLMAVVPAVAEELLFRGYLFGALSAVGRPRSAILISALLFGVFHIFLSGLLSWERLLVSGLLGLVLGWVRWRTASVWPGMVLHACHNGLVVVATLARDRGPFAIQDLNWGILLPWLVAGAGGATVGALLVAYCRRRVRPENV